MPVLEGKNLRVSVLAALLLLALTGCMDYPVANLDATGQKFASGKDINEAIVRVAKTVPLARYRGLAVITPPDCRINADEVGQLKEIGFFEEVVGLDDLPGFVAERRLLDSTSFSKWADYQALAKAYKPFLIVRFQCIRDGDIWYRLTVTDPETVDHLFVSEVRVWTREGYLLRGLLTLGGGMTVDSDCVAANEDLRLPLYNALLGWINANR